MDEKIKPRNPNMGDIRRVMTYSNRQTASMITGLDLNANIELEEAIKTALTSNPDVMARYMTGSKYDESYMAIMLTCGLSEDDVNELEPEQFETLAERSIKFLDGSVSDFLSKRGIDIGMMSISGEEEKAKQSKQSKPRKVKPQ